MRQERIQLTYRQPEDAPDLCDKCVEMCEEWVPVSERIWENPDDEMAMAPRATESRHG